MAVLKALSKKIKELKKFNFFLFLKCLHGSVSIQMHSLPCPEHTFAKFRLGQLAQKHKGMKSVKIITTSSFSMSSNSSSKTLFNIQKYW